MNIRPMDFQPGDRFTAMELNALRAEVNRLGRINGRPPLNVRSEAGGIGLSYDPLWEGWIKLTSHGTGGAYAWTEQVPTTTGGWTNGTMTGTTSVDAAQEASANATVSLSPNPVVYAWRNTAGVVTFVAGSC